MGDNNRSKILIVVYHPIGGIRTYFKDVYGQQFFDKYDLSILMPEDRVFDLKKYVFESRDIECIPFKDNIDLIRCVWRILGESEYGFVNSHGFTSGLLASLPARIRGAPHLMTVHDVFQASQFKGVSGYMKRWIISVGFRLIDCIMAVGIEARENISEHFPFLKGSEKLISIQNGIDVNKFSDEKKRNFHTELNLNETCVLFGFFGRFMKQKGFRLLVDAVNDLVVDRPTLDFRVLTFGWGGFIREEQAYIKGKGLDDRFIFMSHTDDVPAAIRGVDAVVMPSLWEACPLLPMEVMVSGVPLISSDCIGLHEVTDNTPAISFRHGKVHDLKRSIIKYLDNDSKYIKQALAFKSDACLRYDVASTAKKLQQQYQRMIENVPVA